ncbi:xylulokinase [Frateuria aurantia]
MFIGIDLGTSSVKVVLLDRRGEVRCTASAALTLSHPQPRWSEQDPEAWWQATLDAMDAVLAKAGQQGLATADIEGIGLSGQMHGATLLGRDDAVLRPAILWNDGRCDQECIELEQVEGFRQITGNLAMPGFTAPKLMWVRRHEPEVFARIAKVLLPKDYLRLRLTGGYATDMSDAAGTLWLDVATRKWSEPMLAACGLEIGQMPELHEGSAVTGTLLPELAQRWGLQQLPVAAGGGDNAAGAVGVGIVKAGQAMLSLGTSGVYFAVSDGFLARPESAVHSFCHALPDTWHLMSVMLSAASCLDFSARLAGYQDVPALLADAEAAGAIRADSPWFLPYLNGERTPHNDTYARGAFVGLSATSERADLANATLEGVGLGLLDGVLAVEAAGLHAEAITVIGGGSRSAYWLQMLADILGRPLQQRAGGDVGPALGAARLAWLAVDPRATLEQVCPSPPLLKTFEPVASRRAFFREQRYPVFRKLYTQLHPIFGGVVRDANSVD